MDIVNAMMLHTDFFVLTFFLLPWVPGAGLLLLVLPTLSPTVNAPWLSVPSLSRPAELGELRAEPPSDRSDTVYNRLYCPFRIGVGDKSFCCSPPLEPFDFGDAGDFGVDFGFISEDREVYAESRGESFPPAEE
jgi:hypothetical protein